MTDTVEVEEQPPELLGELFRRHRLAKNLTLANIAEKLHIKEKIVESIEQDSIDPSINPLFSKGYVRSYAAMLGLDKAKVLTQFEMQYAANQASTATMQTFSNRNNIKREHSYLTLVSVFIALLLVAILVAWWYQQAEQTSVTLTDGVHFNELPAEQVNHLQQASMQLIEVSSELAHSMVRPISTDIQLSKATLSFAGDCWVRITDASNEIVSIGMKAQGQVINIEGVAPFEVILGAPKLVTISYQNQPIDFSPFVNGDTARFSVPLVN